MIVWYEFWMPLIHAPDHDWHCLGSYCLVQYNSCIVKFDSYGDTQYMNALGTDVALRHKECQTEW